MKNILILIFLITSAHSYSNNVNISGDIGFGYFSGDIESKSINGLNALFDLGVTFQKDFFVGGLAEVSLGEGGYANVGVLAKYDLIKNLKIIAGYIAYSTAEDSYLFNSDFDGGTGFLVGADYSIYKGLGARLTYQAISYDEVTTNGLFTTTTTTSGSFDLSSVTLSAIYNF